MSRRLSTTPQRYSGAVGVVVIWSLIIVAMRRAHLGLIDDRPISYLGVDPRTKLLFSLALTLSAILFLVFGWYVRRVFKVRGRFITYFAIGQIGQIITALVPDTPHTRHKIVHTIAAFVLAFSLPLLIKQFVGSQVNSPRRRLYLGLLRFEQAMLIIGLGLFIFTRGIAPLGEALPTIGFDVWILVLTALGP